MSTSIYPSPIYGPIHSRRLGISLGINIMPADGKICSFDCIYCECGYNAQRRTHSRYPTTEMVTEALESKLIALHQEGVHPDVLTFAGNGEPTGNPDFAAIIDATIDLRNIYCPSAKISVLSNSTFIDRPAVREALMKVDNNILKLDTADATFINLLDRPQLPSYDVRKIIEQLKAFNGHCIIQTIFLKGTTDEGISIDNTTDHYVTPWLDAVREIAPQAVMIYTIDRETPCRSLLKATHEELDSIRDRVQAMGYNCTVAY